MSHDPAEAALVRLLGMLGRGGYRFVTPTPATHARVDARAGHRQARDLADVFGWSRPFADEVVPPELLALMREAEILERDGPLWRSRIRVSSLGGLLFAHSASPTVAAESVFFGPDTYRFARAISAALRERSTPVRRAVDIGCGAGPGAILVAAAHPMADSLMVDINDAALRLARVNAAAAGLTRAVALRSDLLTATDGTFDLIVSNPPYLNDPLERAYRHGGGALGAALSLRILDAALPRLAPGGTLVLYTGVAIVRGRDPFRQEGADRLAEAPDLSWSYEEIDPDVFGEELDSPAYAQADRIAAVVLSATRRQP